MMSATINSLTQEEFDQGTANWLSILASGDTWLLNRIFQSSTNNERLVNVTFPVEEMAMLVSTAGGRQIETRFLVLKDEDPKGKFAIALYATDVNKKRVSAYYRSVPGDTVLAAPAPKVVPNSEAVPADGVAGGGSTDDMWAVQVPYFIVRQWVDAWSGAALTPEMFANSYGPLRGYTFTFGDFIEPMFYKQGEAGWSLGLDLGLHSYFTAHDEGPTTTFGLALRFYGPNGSSEKSFYDMSMPCPPGYYI